MNYLYIVCIESSRTRGMGHLFRSLLYAIYLKEHNIPFLFLVNDDEKSVHILKDKEIPFQIVDYSDETDWISPIIKDNAVTVWLQDKFETSKKFAENICKNNVLLCMIDEFGPGAELCDIHFAGMIYLAGHKVQGKEIHCGSEYVVLNDEINNYRYLRTKVESVIVSLGGSDPFGMTVEIVRELNKTDLNVEIIIGPDFAFYEQLKEVNINNYPILQNVSSLIQEFSKFDFAITGGGVTCCEANSCGIPCIIFANAPHETYTAKYMENNGGAIYAGSYEGWDKNIFSKIKALSIRQLSEKGMSTFDTKAVERIFTIIGNRLKELGT